MPNDLEDVSRSQAGRQSLPISVLDLIPSRAGESASSAIARSVELARHVEQLGSKRYWVAEHHSIQGLACSATPVLIGHIAAATKTIRVGSGGVMLPNHAPLVVAEQFGTLEAMYPGRIDLGLGRAPGSDFQTMRALRRGLAQDGDDFPALLEELRVEALQVLEKLLADDITEIKLLQEHMHDALGGLIYDRTRRRPMILPVLVEV